MKAIIYLVILACFMQQAQAQIQWQHCYGGTGNDACSAIRATFDGGYILAGYTGSNNGDVSGYHGPRDFWVVKISTTGAIEWQKCYGGSSDDWAYDIRQTADSGYIVAGYTYSNDGDVTGNHGGEDAWVIKISPFGILQWQKCFGGSGNDYAGSVVQTSAGEYIVGATTNSNDGDVSGNHGGDDAWVLKLTDTGTIVWARCFGGSSWDFGYSVQETFDGGFIVGGTSYSNDGEVTGHHGDTTTDDMWVVKLSVSGSLVWEKSLGGSDWDFGGETIQTMDSGYIVAGSAGSVDGDVTGHIGGCYSCGPQGLNGWVVKLSNGGTIQWDKCIYVYGNDRVVPLFQTGDGGYIFAGNARPYIGNSNALFGKLSGSGGIEWIDTLGGSSGDTWLGSGEPTNYGSGIAAGSTSANDGDVSGNHGGEDYWVVKFGWPTGVSMNDENGGLIIKPNPADNYLSITATEVITDISITNMVGQMVWKSNQLSSVSYKIDISELPVGMYFVKINGIATGKFLK